MGRHGILSYKASLLVDDVSITDAHCTFLLDESDKLHIKMKENDNGGVTKIRSKSYEKSQVVCY